MSDLTDPERRLLRDLHGLHCPNGADCPCNAWARRIADHVRTACPETSDVDLARVVLQTALPATALARETGMSGTRLAGLLGGTAAELASLYLD